MSRGTLEGIIRMTGAVNVSGPERDEQDEGAICYRSGGLLAGLELNPTPTACITMSVATPAATPSQQIKKEKQQSTE